MTSTSPSAFLLSVLLHGTAVALALLLSFAASRDDAEAPRIIELVAGEGDNYAAREAPALGVEGGVKLKLPEAPPPRPAPPPVVEPAPVTPAPPPVAPAPAPASKSAPAANEAIPNFKRKIQYEIVRGDSRAKLQLKREREAEARRLAAERKRISKEEFDRAQKNQAAPAAAGGKTPPTKVARIDSEGIAKGVIGGSTNNKIGGAGGKALQSNVDDVLEGYYALFKQKLRTEFEPPPGLSDSLKATVAVQSNADGSLTQTRIVRSSGSREFDRAVIEAIGRVRMPPRPESRKAEMIEFVFTMRETGDG